MAVVAARQAQPADALRLTPEQFRFIHNDPKALEAAECIAAAYVAQAQAPTNWAIHGDVNAMLALTIRSDHKARAACEYFCRVYDAAVAATAA